MPFLVQSTEPWSDEYYSCDVEQCMRDAGFTEVCAGLVGCKRQGGVVARLLPAIAALELGQAQPLVI